MLKPSPRNMCAVCKNNINGKRCKAFPVEIPYQILENIHDHREEYPGDNGILFDPESDEAKQYVDRLFGELHDV